MRGTRGTSGNFRPEYSRNARPDYRDRDRNPDRRRDHDRRRSYPWFVPYYLGYPYSYSYFGYPYDFGYGDYSSYDDSSYSQDVPYYSPDDQAGYGDQPMEPESQDNAGFRPDYQPSYGPVSSDSDPAGEQAVTLVFKDHRPNQQIHNYLLKGSVLSVWDERPRDIPVSQLDVAATEKVNREAGVDFRLPEIAR